MAYCLKCGQKLPRDASFCSKCGARAGDLSTSNAVVAEVRYKELSTSISSVFGFLFFALGVLIGLHDPSDIIAKFFVVCGLLLGVGYLSASSYYGWKHHKLMEQLKKMEQLKSSRLLKSE